LSLRQCNADVTVSSREYTHGPSTEIVTFSRGLNASLVESPKRSAGVANV
jgi:hypothetical protein